MSCDDDNEDGYHTMQDGRVAVYATNQDGVVVEQGCRACIWRKGKEEIAWHVWKLQKLCFYAQLDCSRDSMTWVNYSFVSFAKTNNERIYNAMRYKSNSFVGFYYAGFTAL